MQDLPEPARLVELTADFLRAEVMPELTGAKGFQLRVAINALDLVARQLRAAAESDAAERDRLIALLGAEGTIADLNRLFSEKIASGEMTPQTPGVADHLWASTMEKLAVDQPTYAAYRRERERSPS